MGSSSSSEKKDDTNAQAGMSYNVDIRPENSFNPQYKIHEEVYQPPRSEQNDLSRQVVDPFNPAVWCTSNLLPETHSNYKDHPSFEKGEQNKSEVPHDKFYNLAYNTSTSGAKPAVTEKVSFDKRECFKASRANYMKSNKSASISAIPPSKMLTRDDFMTKWFSWKNDFIKHMKLIDKGESNKQKWGMMLLNLMGPIGQEIYKSFAFDINEAKDNINVLLEKFDCYCIFGGRIKGDDEEIDKYVNSLKVMASKHLTDTNNIVKQKILKEIDKNKFTSKAKSFIPEFSFSLNIQSLSLKEITYIWMVYENVDYGKGEKIENLLVWNCHNCGGTHIINECPARGKRCNKCGNENHYWMRCPSQYVADCIYCGANHFIRQCPAYLNECSKCHRQNHFCWKCSIPKILNCNFCGMSHIASKSACYAINAICTKCYKRGHFVTKCNRR